MSLFGRKEKKTIQNLEKEIRNNQKRIRQLENLCDRKDSFFKEMISDGLRHGSPLAGKHMSDLKKYKNGK